MVPPGTEAHTHWEVDMSNTAALAVDASNDRDQHFLTHNREVWLSAVTERLRPIFKAAGHDIPKVRVSVGFPTKGGAGSRQRVVGQCHYAGGSADGTVEVFIHPGLEELPLDAVEDAAQAHGVTSTLAHELAHACLPPSTGHKGAFVTLVRALHLEGKPTATTPSIEFASMITGLLDGLPPYPGAKLTVVPGPKQSTRLLKVYCPDDGYTMRITNLWLMQAVPDCPLCQVPMLVNP